MTTTDIPEWARRDAATALLSEMTFTGEQLVAVARALMAAEERGKMAERERCAKIAEREAQLAIAALPRLYGKESK